MAVRVLAVFGTRPEAIKMIPVVEALKKAGNCDYRVCVTGQHRQMLDHVVNLFNVQVDYDLDIMRENQGLSGLTSAALEGVGSVISQWRPDWTLTQGDTTSAFATALAAFYQKVKVAHIEAGLRTGNIYSPWPEEMNRKLITHMANIHFAPTVQAGRNLEREGVAKKDIFVTGNTVIDALLDVSGRLDRDAELKKSLAETFPFLDPSKKMILVTGHRRENFGEGFRQICLALKKLSERDDVQIVYPVHLNPNVQKPVGEILGEQRNIMLIEPQGYLQFVYLMKSSYIIISDSGGVQEEAPSLGKPVLVMRDTTERPEAVEAGTVRIVGTDSGNIVTEAEALLDDKDMYRKMAMAHNPYGDGLAAGRIVKELMVEREL